MTGVDVEHTKALEAAATPGPWEIIGGNEYLTGVDIGVGSPEGIGDADAEFIAHARTAVPALVAAVERVQALHFQYLPAAVDFDCCAHCNQNSGGYVEWPCPTIRALEMNP